MYNFENHFVRLLILETNYTKYYNFRK